MGVRVRNLAQVKHEGILKMDEGLGQFGHAVSRGHREP